MLDKINPKVFESFERAFMSSGGGCVRACRCGRIFYNPDGGWTWEDGELESLNRNEKATAVGHTVQCIDFEENEYALDCDCWHELAARYIRWLRVHDEQVAEFLTLEKARKQAEADRSPVVR